MNEYIKSHVQVTVYLLVIAVALIATAGFVHYTQQSLERTLRENTHTVLDRMNVLADIIDRNGADDTVASIVKDCAEREEYESLLVKLGNLNKRDLIRIQTLSENCGSFYAERKALMVDRLKREYEELLRHNAALQSLAVDPIAAETLETWSELIISEEKRSQLLADQVTIQDEIIRELVTGSYVNSKEVLALVRDGQDVAGLLTVIDHQIDELRAHVVE
jgi:hypothetical protein